MKHEHRPIAATSNKISAGLIVQAYFHSFITYRRSDVKQLPDV